MRLVVTKHACDRRTDRKTDRERENYDPKDCDNIAASQGNNCY